MSGRSLSLTSLACHMTCITDWQDSSFTSRRRPGWLRLRHLFYSHRQIIYFCYTLYDDKAILILILILFSSFASNNVEQNSSTRRFQKELGSSAGGCCSCRSNMVQDFAVENIEAPPCCVDFSESLCVRLSRLLCDVTKERSVWKAVNKGPKQNLKYLTRGL